MARILPALLIAAALLSACGETEQVSPRTGTKADLARLAFDALQAGDFEPFQAALPTAADTLWMLDTRGEHAAPEQVQAMRDLLAERGGEDAVAVDAASRLRTSFDATRQVAAESFDWAKATFEGLVEDQSKSMYADGLELADVYFTLLHDGRQEIVQLVHCARVDRGWVVTGAFRHVANPHESVEDARTHLVQMQLRMVHDAVKLYEVTHGKLPENLAALLEADPKTGEPFVQPELRDPWKHPFHVAVVEGRARVTSAGPDGQLDTDDDVVVQEPDAE